MPPTKNLFIVDSGFREEHAELVVAESEYQAKVVCLRYACLDMDNSDDIGELNVERIIKTLDGRPIPQEKIDANDWGEVSDDRLRRDVGFACDGDDRCGSCGLAELDGSFPVCKECCNCKDCGCDCESESAGESNGN